MGYLAKIKNGQSFKNYNLFNSKLTLDGNLTIKT